MYSVYLDGNLLYMPLQNEFRMHETQLTRAGNTTGAFDFKLVKLPSYIQGMKSVIEVYDDEDLIYQGRVLDINPLLNTYGITTEGYLGVLNDSFCKVTKTNAKDAIVEIITSHNKYCPGKKINIGTIEVTTPIAKTESNYTKSWDAFSQILENTTGYLYFDFKTKTLDYLNASRTSNNQAIRLSENILDVNIKNNEKDIKTAILPLGNNDITISSINNGNMVLIDETAEAKYGLIYEVVNFDTTSISDLLKKAKEYLKTAVAPLKTIELSAVDLSYINSSLNRFNIHDLVTVYSEPHRIDLQMAVTSIELNIQNPSESKIQFGQKVKELSDPTKKENKIDTTLVNTVVDKTVEVVSTTTINNVVTDTVTGKNYRIVPVMTDGGIVKDTTGVTLKFGFMHNTARTETGGDIAKVVMFDVVDATQGIYEVTYPSEMLVVGNATCQIQVDDNGKITNTKLFVVRIVKDVITDKTIVAQDSPTVIQQALISISDQEGRISRIELNLESLFKLLNTNIPNMDVAVSTRFSAADGAALIKAENELDIKVDSFNKQFTAFENKMKILTSSMVSAGITSKYINIDAKPRTIGKGFCEIDTNLSIDKLRTAYTNGTIESLVSSSLLKPILKISGRFRVHSITLPFRNLIPKTGIAFFEIKVDGKVLIPKTYYIHPNNPDGHKYSTQGIVITYSKDLNSIIKYRNGSSVVYTQRPIRDAISVITVGSDEDHHYILGSNSDYKKEYFRITPKDDINRYLYNADVETNPILESSSYYFYDRGEMKHYYRPMIHAYLSEAIWCEKELEISCGFLVDEHPDVLKYAFTPHVVYEPFVEL